MRPYLVALFAGLLLGVQMGVASGVLVGVVGGVAVFLLIAGFVTWLYLHLDARDVKRLRAQRPQ